MPPQEEWDTAYEAWISREPKWEYYTPRGLALLIVGIIGDCALKPAEIACAICEQYSVTISLCVICDFLDTLAQADVLQYRHLDPSQEACNCPANLRVYSLSWEGAS
jgi:hypothetical protein